MLAEHPDEQQAARDEVDAVLAGRPATAADLRRLPGVRAVVDETLRLNPDVYSTVRDPVEPWHAAGVVFPHGVDIVIPIGGIHRDPRNWEAPEEFRPARFLDEAAAAERSRLAHIPFGIGPRICIGSSFALQELVLVLATLLQEVEWTMAPGERVRPQTGFIRRPAGELRLQVRRRRTHQHTPPVRAGA
jgi:cytochrome P450